MRLVFQSILNHFQVLVDEVRQHLLNTNRLHYRVGQTPLELIMMMTMWILNTNDTFRSVAIKFGTSPGVLHYHYVYVLEALREMACHYITWPTAEERAITKNHFLRRHGYPGVVGSIDGTHIYITAPVGEEKQAYVNRHHSHSILVQAVVDHRLLVRDLYVGEPGSFTDARVFRRSPLRRNLLGNADMLNEDEHILGDGGYALTDKVITFMINYEVIAFFQLASSLPLSVDCLKKISLLFSGACTL